MPSQGAGESRDLPGDYGDPWVGAEHRNQKDQKSGLVAHAYYLSTWDGGDGAARGA